MNKYSLGELYSLYVLEFKKDKPLFESTSFIEFLVWLQKREAEELGRDEGNSPFDSAMDAQGDYTEEGR